MFRHLVSTIFFMLLVVSFAYSVETNSTLLYIQEKDPSQFSQGISNTTINQTYSNQYQETPIANSSQTSEEMNTPEENIYNTQQEQYSTNQYQETPIVGSTLYQPTEEEVRENITYGGARVYQFPFMHIGETCVEKGGYCSRDEDCCEGLCINNRCMVYCGEGFCCPAMEGSPYFQKPCPNGLQCCLNDYPQDEFRGVCKQFCCSMENETCEPPHYCCYGLKCVNGKCVRPTKFVISPWLWVVAISSVAVIALMLLKQA